MLDFFFFFFQAEDGIRESSVTGVQTCALPISARPPRRLRAEELLSRGAEGKASPACVAGGAGRIGEDQPGRRGLRGPAGKGRARHPPARIRTARLGARGARRGRPERPEDRKSTRLN